MDRLPLRVIAGAKDDLDNLPESVKKRALQLLTSITEQPFLGQECTYRADTGDLSDCRKLYFDESEDREPRYRLVYRIRKDEQYPEGIQLLAVGLKFSERLREGTGYIYQLWRSGSGVEPRRRRPGWKASGAPL